MCTGEDFAAGEVASIMQLGALLEELTVTKVRTEVENLVRLTPQTWHRCCEMVKNRPLRPSKFACNLPGGREYSVDGVIIAEQTSINQASHDRQVSSGRPGRPLNNMGICVAGRLIAAVCALLLL